MAMFFWTLLGVVIVAAFVWAVLGLAISEMRRHGEWPFNRDD